MRPVISFDVDGVIAQGGYIPVEERTNKAYFSKPLIDEWIPAYLHLFSICYDIYLVSYRHHDDANLGLRAWVTYALGLGLDVIAGVITYPGDPTQDTDVSWKTRVIQGLGSQAHFDDDPDLIGWECPKGIYFPSEVPSRLGLEPTELPTLHTWREIQTFLLTPDMVVHGEWRSVVSPATPDMSLPQLPIDAPVEMV